MAGRGVAQGAGLGVEHDDGQGDELLVPADARHLLVELLERLGRVAVLAQEHPQEVLGLEGGDRGLDAVAGHVADDRGQAAGRRAEHVVEVAGHVPAAGLVDRADLEAREVVEVLGGQAGGPPLRGQLLLGEHLLGPPLELGAALGEAGVAGEGPAERQAGAHRDEHEQERPAPTAPSRP